MATSGDQSIEQEYEDLTNRQRLRAAVHFTTMKICQEAEEKYDMPVNQQVIATITETVWRQMETFATDLEEFARHARRSVISPDDVKLLIRRNPSLLKHIQNMHKEQITAREELPYKPKKTKKVRPTQIMTSDSEAEQQRSRAQRGPQQQKRTATATVTAPQTMTSDSEAEQQWSRGQRGAQQQRRTVAATVTAPQTVTSEAEQQWSRAQRGPQQQRRTVTATAAAPQTVTPDFEWEMMKVVEEAEGRTGWRQLDVEAAYSHTVRSNVDREQMEGDGELPVLPRRAARGAPSHTVTSEMMQEQARAHDASSWKKKFKKPDTGRRRTPDETEALFRQMVEQQIQEARERRAERERALNQIAADAEIDQRLLQLQRMPGRRQRIAEIADISQGQEVDMEEG